MPKIGTRESGLDSRKNDMGKNQTMIPNYIFSDLISGIPETQ